MEYGCIGERLAHSFSCEIHSYLADYKYELKEIPKDALNEFMLAKDFKAINVTIPYKAAVIPFLDYIEPNAKQIGAVNTVVNKNGKLYGYNTDFYGFDTLLKYNGVSLTGKRVAVLGTGGTSHTVCAVARYNNAAEIFVVSRTPKLNQISYDKLCSDYSDVDVIINTTPSGMYPNCKEKPVDLNKFGKLSAVVDVVYNPLNTALVAQGNSLNINSFCGLYMLVAQAAISVGHFIGSEISAEQIETVYKKILKNKQDIVLIGMPSSGKSTVGAVLAQKLNKEFVDTDLLFERKFGISPADAINLFGEEKFRQMELDAVYDASTNLNSVIACGGGVVLRKENIDNLKMNGTIFFLNRSLENLITTSDRPLSSTKEKLKALYEKRLPLYEKYADIIIDANGAVNDIVNEIERCFK